jgi:thioredoxin reductase (NADPH)
MKKIVQDNGLKIKFHEQVEKITKLKNKQLAVKTNNDVYISDAVFIAIGNMSAPRTLGISVHENVSQRIFYDLQNVKSEMHKVLVVGGGDSAGEYAKILVDRGHEVTLSYRGENFARMIASNVETTLKLIEEKKLKFLPSSQIEKIEEEQGMPLISFRDSKYKTERFDAVVTALGTERPTQYLTSLGIRAESEGEDIFTESEMNGLFLVGDLASGKHGGTINFAFNSGVKAFAKACSLYLDCD